MRRWLDRLSDAVDPLDGQILHDDDVALPQLGNQRPFDIGEKASPFIGPSRTMGAAMPSWRSPSVKVVVFQWPRGTGGASSFAPRRTTIKAGHLGVGGGLIDEDDPRRIEVELSFKPSLARRVHRCGAVRRRAPSFLARDLAMFEEP